MLSMVGNVPVFQFHSGSIRASAAPRNQAMNVEFQFHSGSIRAKSEYTAERDRVSFNSTLVRLGLPGGIIQGSWTRKFQFHSGSIRAKPPATNLLCLKYVSIPLWFD